jgi:hypothetical protein
MLMKRSIQKLPVALIAAMLLTAYSCTKNWDDKYPVPAYVDNGSTLNIINKNSNYKEFASLLHKTGYDSVLRRTDLNTVLAIKNGGFSGIDTNNLVIVKRVLGMHILPTAIYPQNMANTYYISISGKPVNFTNSSGQAANGLAITTGGKATNGVIYDIAQAMLPTPNIFEAIAANSSFSIFNQYITTSYLPVPDPAKNTITGYDATNKPIYQPPITYILSSTYLNDSKIKDEATISTAFIPTNTVVNTQLSKMLQARNNIANLVIPRLGTAHNDTTIGGSFVLPKGVPYPGDSTLLKDYLFRHVITRGNIKTLAASNVFTNIAGNPLTVSSAQVTGGVTSASNGSYYTVNDITLPDLAYRAIFMFAPTTKNAAGATITNPNIIYTNGAINGNAEVSGGIIGTRYRATASRFNFTKVGAKIDFKIPLVTKGYYKVLLKNFLDNNGAIVSANYGSQVLKQNFNTSTQYTQSSGQESVVDVDLGTINVAADGAVQITFTCAAVSPKAVAPAVAYLFTVDMLMLIPVNTP